MTVEANPQTQANAPQPSDKEINFRRQEEMYNRKLEQERVARQQAEDRLAQLEKMVQERPKADEDDDASDEPYVDHRRLKKELGKVKQSFNETENRIQQAVQMALAEERRMQWLEQTPDFGEVMNHAETFAAKDPALAKTILNMPDGFERQKLVYQTIKLAGLHKPKEEPRATMQDKINSDKRNLFYSPTNAAVPPYENKADFSEAGKKQAYTKMMELKKRMGLSG